MTRDRGVAVVNGQQRSGAAHGLPRRLRALLLLGVVALVSTACQTQLATDGAREHFRPGTVHPWSSSVTSGVRKVLALHFSPGEPLRNAGAEQFRIGEVTAGAGALERATPPRGRGIRFPAFSAAEDRYAAIAVRNLGAVDWLQPGNSDFAFGASFSLDARSDGSSSDNGDNLVQRGLFESPSMYKLQVDERHLSCVVRGLEGQVVLQATNPVTPGRWYRAICARHGEGLVLKLATLDRSGRGSWAITRMRGPIGPVVMPVETPLSIGGKLSGDGTLLPSSTDQFNGAVSNVFARMPTFVD